MCDIGKPERETRNRAIVLFRATPDRLIPQWRDRRDALNRLSVRDKQWSG